MNELINNSGIKYISIKIINEYIKCLVFIYKIIELILDKKYFIIKYFVIVSPNGFERIFNFLFIVLK